MKEIDPKALFRLSVLSPLVSRERLERGELQQIIRELALRDYAILGSRRHHPGEKTIEAWYYRWRREGIAGLTPKIRLDRGESKLSPAIQAAILAAKRDNPRRSIRQIRRLLEAAGSAARGTLSRSAIHRLLQQHGLSRMSGQRTACQYKKRTQPIVLAFAPVRDIGPSVRAAKHGENAMTIISSRSCVRAGSLR